MFLAKVVGKVVATQKSQKLVGSKLLIVKSIDEQQNVKPVDIYVAVDVVGAGCGEIVLIDWGSSAYEDVRITSDMAVVGIVDSIELEGD